MTHCGLVAKDSVIQLRKLGYHLGVKVVKFHITLESYKVTVFGGQKQQCVGNLIWYKLIESC